WLVCVASISSSPARLTVAATLLSGVAAAYVVAVVLLGRAIYLTLFLLLVTRATHWLERVPLLGRAVQKFQAFKAEVLATQRPADGRVERA
ncbi:MAG: hypothetical protein EB072_09170, partial [Betaproteobacteria bacterium]|nr:hypothetical protein [Betaproteobacteria bacterium]